MAVGVGTNAKLMLDGYDMSCYFREVAVEMSKELLDATTFCYAARSKVAGIKHARLTGTAFSDHTATIGSWDLLTSKFPSGTAGTFAFGPHGFALGSQVITIYSEAVKFQNQNIVDDLQRLMTEAEARSNAADVGVSL